MDNLSKCGFTTPDKVVVVEPVRRAINVVDSELDLLLLLKGVGHGDLGHPVGVQVVLDRLRPGELFPVVATERLDKDHAHGVTLGEEVEVPQRPTRYGELDDRRLV